MNPERLAEIRHNYDIAAALNDRNMLGWSDVPDLLAEVDRLQSERAEFVMCGCCMLLVHKNDDTHESECWAQWNKAQLADELAEWVKGAWHPVFCSKRNRPITGEIRECDCGRDQVLDRYNDTTKKGVPE